MRLNHVELFYAFATRTARRRGGQPPCRAGCKGQLATAKAPYKGATDHSQNPLAGAAASRRRLWAWLALAGAALASVGSTHGQAAGGDCPLCRARVVPPKGSSACCRGAYAGAAVAVAQSRQEGRSRRMMMRQSDGIDDDEINNHRAWRCANAYIDPIVSG
ncbi:hypothetical protein GW17_00036872 [Ensete ventricosum]|nr:hypothetical protein GW17_00036872 [Ensete ventricosum]